MALRDFWRREKHVALNAQPRRFRIAKWIIILFLLSLLYYYDGWQFALGVFLTCCAVGACVHFFLRYKTKGWTQDWGPYKRIKLDGE